MGPMPSTTRHRAILPAHLVRKVCDDAYADPRSLRKLLAGRPLALMTRARLLRALEERGLVHLVPSTDVLVGGERA